MFNRLVAYRDLVQSLCNLRFRAPLQCAPASSGALGSAVTVAGCAPVAGKSARYSGCLQCRIGGAAHGGVDPAQLSDFCVRHQRSQLLVLLIGGAYSKVSARTVKPDSLSAAASSSPEMVHPVGVGVTRFLRSLRGRQSAAGSPQVRFAAGHHEPVTAPFAHGEYEPVPVADCYSAHVYDAVRAVDGAVLSSVGFGGRGGLD